MLRSKSLCTRHVALLGLVMLGGCVSGPEFTPRVAASQADPALGQAAFTQDIARDYVLRPADVLSVRVFREEGLSLDAVPVSAMGQISMPLIGTLTVAGKTAPQIEAEMETLLGARYLRNPDVAVNVVNYASHQVTVEGSVQSPGVFNFLPGTRLSGGIALASGTVREADTQNVAVIRQTAEGRQIAKFDYRAVQTGAMIDPVLQPGDRIIVGTNGLAVFWKDLLQTIPVFGVFTNF